MKTNGNNDSSFWDTTTATEQMMKETPLEQFNKKHIEFRRTREEAQN
jgi:hypothetical protein